jgi:hypothetical protein
MVCAVNADVQFRAIPLPGQASRQAGPVMYALVKRGALGGTRTPNLDGERLVVVASNEGAIIRRPGC